MSMDDSKPGGLFSKMVRFVRHPTVHWSEIAVPPSDPQGEADKQVLRQTLERKRRNDFVRHREFDQLRKLRKQAAAQSGALAFGEASCLPTEFHTGLTSPDARAVTLQKIAVIEEQMSEQWWLNKPPPADAPTVPMDLISRLPEHDSVHVPGERAASAGAEFDLILPLDWKIGVPQGPPEPSIEPQRQVMTTTFSTSILQHAPQLSSAAPQLSSAAPQLPAQAPVFVHDPDFEEAAIAFANGDVAGAEASLLELLVLRQAQPPTQWLVWQALFDLYRAAGLADRFEVQAIEYAARFDRSAPLWFSLPALRGGPEPRAAALEAAAGLRTWRWSAPAVLTQQSVAALQQAKSRALAPWTVDWQALERIEADAVASFDRVVTEWAQTPGQMVFLHAPVLLQRLQALTVSGDREAPEDGWRLRMACLRLMQQYDSFELAALDYCVTYEVSPPSWIQPLSSYVDGLAPVSPGTDEQASGAAAPTLPAGGTGLAGWIDSDATPWLAALEVQARPDQPLVVDCSELIRLDFAAAGSVLNWSARMQAQGYTLRFERMHQLVAVFFGMIGVGDHAQLLPRSD